MQRRAKHVIALYFCSSLIAVFVFFLLGSAELGRANPCSLDFPVWFGCVLNAHEDLAGGVIGAAVTLAAAWVAWIAVQQQINADRERTTEDRREAERLLCEELTRLAEGMAAAWRLLVNAEENGQINGASEARDATAYMAERLSRPEKILNYRQMADVLGWERRVQYNAVISGMEGLRAYADAELVVDAEDVLNAIRNLADDLEICLPKSSSYFEGLWRRTPKAMSFADFIEYIGRPGRL